MPQFPHLKVRGGTHSLLHGGAGENAADTAGFHFISHSLSLISDPRQPCLLKPNLEPGGLSARPWHPAAAADTNVCSPQQQAVR